MINPETKQVTTQSALGRLIAFLDRLEEVRLWYNLTHVRDTLMVVISVPGERWEVEFFEDGEIEIERFVSQGVDAIEEDALYQLLADWSK